MCVRTVMTVVCLPIEPVYPFHLHSCYNQLISDCMLEEENSGSLYSVDIDMKLHPDRNNCITLLTQLQLFTSPCTDSTD